MYKTPSHLPDAIRRDIARELNARLADGLDLHSQLKVAHWNVRGPQFPALHPLFEQFATQLATHNDALAERAVTLGTLAIGTARQVAGASKIAEYPGDTTRDLDHVKALADRIDCYLERARETRVSVEAMGDDETVDLLTSVISDFEKNAWFLRATLA
ncbi:MAG TPA: DNA starvation/stationary phase protection protein Dps [Kofleriaceae bacterium]|nr:DNA starvation/stationary phase protection protein Dps [Kofleriaceae bacterium]